MNNKSFKNSLLIILIITIIFILSLTLIINYSLNKYEENNNKVISTIITNIKEEYPNLDDKTIIEIISTDKLKEDNILKRYGIDIKNESISSENEKLVSKTITMIITLIIIYTIVLFFIFIIYNLFETRKIKKITSYLKAINNKEYKLDMLSNSEDELSLLKNEIYKTAITLNEQTAILNTEKENLKDSLSDISHQIKTPLTSITLMIDTLMEEEVDSEKRKKLLINIHRKISNINFLIQSILKLSKFDANAIEFIAKNNYINDILNEVKDNLAILSDLKNIKINIKGEKSSKLYCDYKWQVEAITNIVKNCIEHSESGEDITITYETNELFTKIIIKDNGVGMTPQEQKNIFKRFYKGKNSSKDSVGIGLALAKMIIEKDNGYIIVNSKIGDGTTFTIKYIK